MTLLQYQSFKNGINIGLPILVCPKAVDAAKENSVVEVNTEKGTVVIDGKMFNSEPFPEFVNNIIIKGGLMEYVKDKIKN